MKRVGNNVSIEKVPSRSNVTITPTTSNSSLDNNEDDDYYNEEEDEEFEPSPPVVRTPNLSQVQVRPRTRSSVNITPVQPIGTSGIRNSAQQVSSSKIPDRPFKIFSKENKALENDDDDIIIESTSIKTPTSFAKPVTPVKNFAPPPVRAPNLRMNRPPVLPPSPQMPRGRTPNSRSVSPRVQAPFRMRSPMPQPRQRFSNQTQASHNVNFRPQIRGRPSGHRGPFAPPLRIPNPPGPRMQMGPRNVQIFPRQTGPRAPHLANMSRNPPSRLQMARPVRPQNTPPPLTRKVSNQVQITRAPAPKPQPQPPSPAQAMVNVKPEPMDYEEEEEDEYDDYEDAIPNNTMLKPSQKLSTAPVSSSQLQKNTVPKLSSSIQITPKVSSQVQIIPKGTPHVTQARLPQKHVVEEPIVKEKTMDSEHSEEHYDKYEEQEEDYYEEGEEQEMGEEEEEEEREGEKELKTCYVH
uniref:Uncharacterized protein n=1 Tax=Cacopsylla melanoneura TaxID=428564 RepID=A0A8D8M9Q1_9HEMI